MISTHCGQRLRTYGSPGSYWEDCATKRRYHAWKCAVCGRIFEQTIRRPKADQQATKGA